MTYYRVIVPDKLYRLSGYYQTIGGELFTPAEYRRYSTPDKYGCKLRAEWVEQVQVSQHNTYWFFGARFAAGTLAGAISNLPGKGAAQC